MTQEDKKLLIKDLCARLPYGVIVETTWAEQLTDVNGTIGTLRGGQIELFEDGDYSEIIAYLRPMSSMTEDEKDELLNLLFDKDAKYFYIDEEGFIDGKTSDLMKEGLNYPSFCPINIVLYTDWLNSHHFDVRNLIGRWLAIDCTGLNIY